MKRNDMERRKQQKHAKLGSNNPICGTCGERDWRCLEAHHVADHARDDATVTVCRNCHQKLSDGQKDHPAFDKSANPSLDTIGHFLLGLVDLLVLVVEKLTEFAHVLIELSKPQKVEGDAP